MCLVYAQHNTICIEPSLVLSQVSSGVCRPMLIELSQTTFQVCYAQHYAQHWLSYPWYYHSLFWCMPSITTSWLSYHWPYCKSGLIYAQHNITFLELSLALSQVCFGVCRTLHTTFLKLSLALSQVCFGVRPTLHTTFLELSLITANLFWCMPNITHNVGWALSSVCSNVHPHNMQHDWQCWKSGLMYTDK